uniref:UTP6 small subunit processome component n=1 Tax=Esox lucius TaxID=8010 RepID=A0A6Q2YAB2_ESOLU
MAEIVQQRIENRIPEWEQLERVGLFTKKEIKSMLKRATALEYKLHRLIISKVDFIAYIQYEINVLELIKKRRSRIGYTFKKEEIEFSIISRINNIFKRATTKWKNDLQLWLSHVAFCKKWNTKGQLSKVFSSMLAIHPEKPAVWIMAAKSEMEDRNSPESARQLFLRALRFHPESQKVYQEYFRMELLHAEKLRKEQKELEKAEIDGEYEFPLEIMSGKLAEVVYRDATTKIQGADFILSLLNIAAIFDFTKELQATIIQDLQGKYADHEVTWDFMARRELDAAVGEELQSAKGRASDIARREERCCQVYEEGLNMLNTEAMWTCYVSFCLERFKRKTNVHELKEKVNISTARQSGLLSVQVQVLLTSGGSEQAAAVAMAATQRHSQSVAMWCLALQTLLDLGSGTMGKIFQDALTHINPKVHMNAHTHTQNWYCKSRPASILSWLTSYIHVFLSLHESRPFSKAFFTRMIQIEKEQETPKMTNLRDFYERALSEFGSTDDDLWLEYIREELGPRGQPENCGRIHWRAMKILEGESVERFITQYTLLQTGHI